MHIFREGLEVITQYKMFAKSPCKAASLFSTLRRCRFIQTVDNGASKMLGDHGTCKISEDHGASKMRGDNGFTKIQKIVKLSFSTFHFI